MMLAMLVILQAAAVPPVPAPAPPVPQLGAIGRQALPPRGCAAYLWNVGDRSLAAMAGADPASLRLKLDGAIVDLPRVARSGDGGFGLGGTTSYAGGDVRATLDMTIAPSDSLTQGAGVPQATLTIERRGADALVQPLAGMIGCAAAA